MALSTREVLMIIRAKDLASAELSRIGLAFGTLDAQAQAAARSHIQQGSALATIGVGMAAAGVAALAFYGGSAKAAMEYNRESALTLTQVDQLGVSLNDVEKIGIRVARAIPAPFKEMQGSLYDIFSSMDVNVKESETLLTAFAKAAVAGQTDIQTAGRATIAILNAFQLPASEVNRVMDVQFQIVRKGVVTYEEFATTIGRAIPSAVNAGQSIEELGGMIAFLTRNGLSAAMAATSAARAMDLFANPKFAKEMKAIGISVFNAAGEFRPLHEVIGELNEVLGDMTAEEQAAALKELTKGAGGTIQAMRFMNTAVRDTNGSLKTLGDFVRNSSGELEEAYKIMSNTPAAKIQALTNTWQIFRVEVGQRVLPIIGALAAAIKAALDWFLDLDDKTKDIIVRVGFLAATFVTLTGILTAIGGVLLILKGTFALLSGAMLPILASVVGFAAVSAAIMYLATQTDILRKGWELLSGWVTQTFMPAIRTAIEIITLSWSGFLEAFSGSNIESTGIVGFFTNLGEVAGNVFRDVKQGVEDFWFAFKNPDAINEQNNLLATWGAKAGEIFDAAVLGVKGFWAAFNGEGVTSDGFVGLMESFGVKAREIFDGIKTAWHEAINYISTSIQEEGFVGAFQKFGEALWTWIQEATPVAIEKLGEFGQAIISWVTDTGLPWLLEQMKTWIPALITWIGDAIPVVIEKMTDLLVAILTFLSENLPKLIEKGGELIASLAQGIGDNLPEIISVFAMILAAIVLFIVTKLIPALIEALAKLIPAYLELGVKIIATILGTFVDVGAQLVTYVTTDLVPSLIKAFLTFVSEFGGKVAGKIVDVVTSPFSKLKEVLVGKSIIPETVDDSLAEWDRFKNSSGQTFDSMSSDLAGKTESLKGVLTKLFQQTGNESFANLRDELNKMPPMTGQVSDETYNAITSVLSGLPGWTGGTGHETQAQWVVNLGKGTGGTSGTTGDWRDAMLNILNPLLQGVGADPVGGGDFANGGIVQFLARGGIEDHIAQIARPGAMRVWAEPETGGEAYIPLAKAKRSRSMAILQEVADRFGMTLAEYAEGDVTWPSVPDFGAFGSMIGNRGGRDTVNYTREKIIAWDNARKEALAAQQAAGGIGGGSLGGGGWQAITNYLDSQGVPYQITSTTGGVHTPGSYHYQGKAVDMVSSNMMQIFNTLAQVGGSLAELFHDPAGWYIKNGSRVDGAIGGHGGHVHGAVMDQGGVLQRGLNMIMNGTGKPEAVFNWDQMQAIEWLMGHGEKVAEASAAVPPSSATSGIQGAATALSGQNAMSIGGRPGYAPSLGMMVETAQHTASVLGSNAGGLEKLGALTGGIGSIGLGMRANASLGVGVGSSAFSPLFGSPMGFGASQAPQGPVINEGAFQFKITGNNPEQIAAQVEAKIRAVIAELRMR